MILNDRVIFRFQYKDKIHRVSMRQTDDIRLLKQKLENLLDFKLTNFKYIYNKNNITFVNENYSIMEFFGTKAKEFLIELTPKEFVEASHLEQFERSFKSAKDFDPDNPNSLPFGEEKSQKQENQPNPNVLYNNVIESNNLQNFNQNQNSNRSLNKSENDKKISQDPSKDNTKYLKERMDDYVHDGRKLCAGDNKNVPTYICTKCRTLWCNYCIKFDVHFLFPCKFYSQLLYNINQ